MRALALLLISLLASVPARADNDFSASFGTSTPEEVGLDSRTLAELTEWIRDNPLPIFSLLISRRGRLVYELYTSEIDRDRAHYLMSVTKSVLSALVGIAIDQKLLGGAEAPIADSLPHALFGGAAGDVARFSSVTIKQVLGMAALDAPDPPRVVTPEAIKRMHDFQAAPNRVRFALSQALLAPHAYQYNDVTPAIAVGLVQYASGKSAFEFARQNLFGPLGFRNAEWMHTDATGIDNGGYGLRLRPIDMQKLGVLFLDHGRWNGRQIISEDWVNRTFTPWIRSNHSKGPLDYGWFWWTTTYASGWTEHGGKGWKGQRIAIFPEEGLVVTMTGCIEDNREDEFFAHIINDYVRPATHPAALPPSPVAQAVLRTRLAETLVQKRVGNWIEPRMVPSAAPKEQRKTFSP